MRSSCELQPPPAPPRAARARAPRAPRAACAPARGRETETARAPGADPHRDEKAEGDNNVKHTPGDRILWLE